MAAPKPLFTNPLDVLASGPGVKGGGATKLGPSVPSGYFNGPKPDAKTAKKAKPSAKVVQVRAHTRTIKPKPDVNTQSVRPAQVSDVKRFSPHRPDEPIAGFTHGIRNPDGTWEKPGGARPQPGASLAERPFYTDAYTTKHGHGPSGQDSTGWNAVELSAGCGGFEDPDRELRQAGVHSPVDDPRRDERGRHWRTC